jgi:hypothetical protein
MQSPSTHVDAAVYAPKRQFMSEMISMSRGSWHDGPTLAEIEQRHGRSQEQIDMSLAVILIVREELARRGKWPPLKGQYPSYGARATAHRRPRILCRDVNNPADGDRK